MKISFGTPLLLLARVALAANIHDWQKADSSAKLDIFDIPQSVWQSFNDSISGRLGLGAPAALPCFTSYQNGSATSSLPNPSDSGHCTVVEQGLNHAAFLVSQFGSYHNPQFSTCMSSGQGCNVSPLTTNGRPFNKTCYQGQVPDYYADVRNVEDIQKSLEFAQRYSLPITVKNTGHDYKGRSTGRHTFAIWTHNIRPPMSLDQTFKPDGCIQSEGPVLTYGAGEVFASIYNYTHDHGYVPVGGACPTVGAAGGWLAGGGFGSLTPQYGLGVDNVVQMRAVLPNGTFVTANRCQNQEVFFALRGGGGGTFGVVTEVTAKVHKEVPVTVALIQLRPQSKQQKRNVTRLFVQNTASLLAAGWGGYMGSDAIGGGVYSFLGVNIKLKVADATTSLQPLLQHAARLSNSTVLVEPMPDYHSFEFSPLTQNAVDAGTKFAIAMSSRLIPKENFYGADNQTALVDALLARDFSAFLGPPVNFELPESDKPGGPGEASVTPAWRNSFWHLVFQNFWDPADPAANTPTAVASQFRSVSKDMDPFRKLTPGSGAYMNEGDTYEPDPISSFWGQKNYNRLLSLKRELDPKNLLSCFRCVGWDQADSQRFGCYPSV